MCTAPMTKQLSSVAHKVRGKEKNSVSGKEKKGVLGRGGWSVMK